jgi:uncharacterized protein YaiL (DUF2058 family)
MGENNVVTTTTDATPDVEQTETVKTEPAKTDKADTADTAEVDKLKAALSRANSQAAEYKRQLRAKQDAAEAAEAERAEQEQAMREELETLRKEKRVSDYTGKCLALNMDADLAGKTATALADGDMESVFDCLKDFVDATVTRLNNEALNRQPNLSTGVPPTKNTTVDTDYENMRRWMGAPSCK